MESKGRVGNRSSRDLVVRLPDHLKTQLTVGKLLNTEGDTGYRALAFICFSFRVIFHIRHKVSFAIRAAIVSWLDNTGPGNIAKDARDTAGDVGEDWGEEGRGEGEDG